MKTKILVVDDDAETRIILADFLSQLNVEHTLVASAGECLARLVSDPTEFSMVLMDIHMPALSGKDACTWIKDSDIDPHRNIPIIAMTADTNYHDSKMLNAIGMRGSLPKPVSFENLKSALLQHSHLH